MGLGHRLGSESEESEPPTESFAGTVVSWEVSQPVTHPNKWHTGSEGSCAFLRAIAPGRCKLHFSGYCMEIVSLLCMEKLDTGR